VTDVTERKEAEEALRESEERFRAIFEGAAVGAALVDLQQGRVAESNPALGRMLGYGEEELRGMRSVNLAHPDDATDDGALVEELLAGERDSYQTEKRYARKDGSILWGRLAVSLTRYANGGPRFLVLMVEDITERKALERRLIQ
jgi:PAS domain S-box-containing protein